MEFNKKLTRRDFLKMSATGVAAATLVACGAEEEPAPEEPTTGDEPVEVPPAEEPAEKTAAKAFGGQQEEADILDEESSDPEIQLDLARAYISMGDKEAARVILEEVASNGSEEQQAEAQKMLDLM